MNPFRSYLLLGLFWPTLVIFSTLSFVIGVVEGQGFLMYVLSLCFHKVVVSFLFVCSAFEQKENTFFYNSHYYGSSILVKHISSMKQAHLLNDTLRWWNVLCIKSWTDIQGLSFKNFKKLHLVWKRVLKQTLLQSYFFFFFHKIYERNTGIHNCGYLLIIMMYR